MRRTIVCAFLVAASVANTIVAHELWLEPIEAVSDRPSTVRIYFGHAGQLSPREILQSNLPRLSVTAVCKDGTRLAIKPSLAKDSYVAALPRGAADIVAVGAELQVGILNHEVHGIPAGTRIVMYAKTGGGARGSARTDSLGHMLELRPVEDLTRLSGGGIARLQLLFDRRPKGGSQIETLLSTWPNNLPSEGFEVATVWSCQGFANPKTGKVAFVVLAPGTYVCTARMIDNRPGTYDGSLRFASDFSHLQPGDKFERTLYIATFSFKVAHR